VFSYSKQQEASLFVLFGQQKGKTDPLLQYSTGVFLKESFHTSVSSRLSEFYLKHAK